MRSKKKKIGLALCSGGIRGFAHIGVLEELEKAGIMPDYIAGTSMGAIIGALYSSGIPIEKIKKIALSEEWSYHFNFARPEKGLIESKKLQEYFRKIIGNKKFSDLKIPLNIIATNINTGKEVVLKNGDVAKATYASMAIPGIFEPLDYRQMKLVDGGLTKPLPINEVKNMGAEIIIAIDLSMQPSEFSMHKNKIYGIDSHSAFLRHMGGKIIERQKELLKEHIINKGKKHQIPDFAKKTVDKIVDMLINTDKIIEKDYIKLAPELADTLSRTIFIMMNQLILDSIPDEKKDLIIIKPNLTGISILDADKSKKAIQAGKRSAIKHTKEILDILDQTA